MSENGEGMPTPISKNVTLGQPEDPPTPIPTSIEPVRQPQKRRFLITTIAAIAAAIGFSQTETGQKILKAAPIPRNQPTSDKPDPRLHRSFFPPTVSPRQQAEAQATSTEEHRLTEDLRTPIVPPPLPDYQSHAGVPQPIVDEKIKEYTSKEFNSIDPAKLRHEPPE